MSQTDIVLLHPPSIYDFRKKAVLFGPISDVVPSSPIFEMYPAGFITLASYLEQRGYQTRIVNLALRMLSDPQFDVPRFLSNLNPKAFGIDLHWLPHAHGGIEIANLLKKLHPNTPTIFGGLSASYFCKELLQYPAVDYVIRGEATEEPLYQLLKTLERGDKNLDKVSNLGWVKEGKIQLNDISFRPQTLDYVDPRPDWLMKQVVRYRDRLSVMPYRTWWQKPVTALIITKGCTKNCVTCGGSNYAFPKTTGLSKPVFRSPKNTVKNVLRIAQFSRGPIFLIGDIRQPGFAFTDELLDLLDRNRVDNEIVFEFFSTADESFLNKISQSVNKWTLQLSPESHDQKIREIQDPDATYSNTDLENTIQNALANNCSRVDVFFMIGLSRQTYDSVMKSLDYIEKLFNKFGTDVSCFISPLGPFLDPGSKGYENPDALGYKIRASTLEEHRELLRKPTWKQMLNYETEWMDRDTLVRATYDAGERLNKLKTNYGRIEQKQGERVANQISEARKLKRELDKQTDENRAPSKELIDRAYTFSTSTVCDKKELDWPNYLFNFRPYGILKALLKGDGEIELK